MTPAEHQDAAEALLAQLYTPGNIGPSYASTTIVEAHAHLAQAAGTGEHYETAEDLLAEAATATLDQARDPLARRALVHAILADR